jgi:NAD(P)-dependent dehydrogenase (short-subunit alcohol dehydrogenase family)
MPTTNRTILITGISRGLGHGLALACLRRGDTVLGLGRNTAADLESFHVDSATIANVVDTQAVDPFPLSEATITTKQIGSIPCCCNVCKMRSWEF